MENKFVRLFVVLSKLMTAEKMKLDRFAQQGEYLAYSISVDGRDLTPSTRFSIQIEVQDTVYSFTNETITDEGFARFEEHLSKFLNILFERKQEFDRNREGFEQIAAKLKTLSLEEQRQLATYIDATPETILRILGVAESH